MAALWPLFVVLISGPLPVQPEGWTGMPDDGGSVRLAVPVLSEEMGEPAPGDVRIEGSPGIRHCVIVAEGRWLDDLVSGSVDGDALSVAVRVAGGEDPILTVVSAEPSGWDGELRLYLDREPAVWHRVLVPVSACKRGRRAPRLVLLIESPMTVDLAGWRLERASLRPSPPLVDPRLWGSHAVGIGSSIERYRQASVQAARGWPVDADATQLSRARESLAAMESVIRGRLIEDWREAVSRGGGQSQGFAVRSGRLKDATGAPLVPLTDSLVVHGCRLEPDRVGRWGAQGHAYTLEPSVTEEKTRRAGADGEVFAPDPMDEAELRDLPELQAAWTAFLRDRYGSDRALRNAWQSPPGMRHGLGPDESLDSLVDGPRPPLATDVRLADYLEWAGEAWTDLADGLTADLRSRSPRDLFAMEPLPPPLDGAATGWHWSLASLRTDSSLPSALWRCSHPLAARFSLSGTGSGARQTGMALADRWLTAGVALPSAAVPVLREAAGHRRATVVVIASRRELALGRSIAPALLATLDDLGVDADILSDAALYDAPDIQSRYKALVYETGSLDDRAFATAWNSALPTFFLGPLDEDTRGATAGEGAQRILAANGAFLARSGPTEALPAAPPATGLAFVDGRQEDPLGTLAQRRHAAVDTAAPAIPDLPELAHRGWEWLFAEGAPVAAPQDSAWLLEIAPCPPYGASAYVNGQHLGQVRLSPCNSPGEGVWCVAVPPSALAANRRNEFALRLPVGQESLGYTPSAAALCPYPRGDLTVTTELHHLKVGNVLATCVSSTRLTPRTEALAPGVAILATYGDPPRSGLLRQGNRLLWPGPTAIAEHDPAVSQALAAFLAMLGEPHAYPATPRNVNLAIAESPGGAVVLHRATGMGEVDLGTNRVLVGEHSSPVPWQRIQNDGRSIVFMGFQAAASACCFICSEMELRPSGSTMTAYGLLRDTQEPDRLVLEGEVEGPGRAVVHSPFTGLWSATASIDHGAVRTGGSGSTVEFDVPAGRHHVRVEVRCPGAGVLDSSLYRRYVP